MIRTIILFFLRPINPQEIYTYISKLKGNNSFYIHGLTNEISKKIGVVMCYPVSHIFNLCLTNGIYPNLSKQ